MKPVLIGMNNPVSSAPEHALYPSPPGCTGHRIWKMLNARTGVDEGEYLEAFERRNLLSSRSWNVRPSMATALADSMIPSLQGRTVVLLGQTVRAAFGVQRQLVHPVESRGVTWRQLPHPSGRCHWYNVKKNREVAELLLEELYLEWKLCTKR